MYVCVGEWVRVPVAALRADRCWRWEWKEKLAVKLSRGSKMYSVGYSLTMNKCCSLSTLKRLPFWLSSCWVKAQGVSIHLGLWGKQSLPCLRAAEGTVNPVRRHHIIMYVHCSDETTALVAKSNWPHLHSETASVWIIPASSCSLRQMNVSSVSAEFS